LFAQRLKQLRKRRNMSMKEVADYVGVAKSTYAGYESGYRQPTLETIQAIATKLSTTSDYLLGLTEQYDPTPQNTNAKEFLNYAHLHWDGVPLEAEDLQLIRQLLERVVRDRAQSEEGQH